MTRPAQARELNLVVTGDGRPTKVLVWETTGQNPPPSAASAALPINRGCRHRGAVLPGEYFPPPDGLGDAVSNALSAIGVTKEWWAAQKAKFLAAADPADCGGCKYRQAFLNWLGAKLPGGSTGKGAAVQKIMELEAIPQQPIQACAVHGKCLPLLNVTVSSRDLLAGAGWRACAGCPDLDLVILETET
jgi:hypothetical protein